MVCFWLGLLGLLLGLVNADDAGAFPALSGNKVITSVYTKTFSAFSAGNVPASATYESSNTHVTTIADSWFGALESSSVTSPGSVAIPTPATSRVASAASAPKTPTSLPSSQSLVSSLDVYTEEMELAERNKAMADTRREKEIRRLIWGEENQEEEILGSEVTQKSEVASESASEPLPTATAISRPFLSGFVTVVTSAGSSESSSSSSSSGCTSATTFGKLSSATEAPACPIPDSTWAEYMIVPVYGIENYGAQLAFSRILTETLGDNLTYTLELDSQHTVYYWTAILNSTQVQLFSLDPVVNYIMPIDVLDSITWNHDVESPGSSVNPLAKRNMAWSNDNDQLYYISQAPGVSDPEGYFFDESQGSGSMIYIVDTGCDPNHSEFAKQNLNDHANWIFPEGLGTTFIDGVEVPWITNDLTDTTGHGTRMAAMAAGIESGVAPDAQLVIVKYLSHPKNVQGRLVYAWMLAALRDILFDVYNRGSGIDSVINHSFMLIARAGAPMFAPGSPYHRIYQDLFALGVTVVTAAGDRALKGIPELNAYPAFLGTTTNLPIILVGGVNSDGTIWPQTQGLQSGRIDVFALSSYLEAPEANIDPNGRVTTNGTSGASAATTGLVAYLLGLKTTKAQKIDPGSFSARMRNYVKSLAYPRIAGGVPVIYNGAPANALESISANYTGNAGGNEKRQVPSCTACVCTSEPTTTPTPRSSIVPSKTNKPSPTPTSSSVAIVPSVVIVWITSASPTSSSSNVVIVPVTLPTTTSSNVVIVPVTRPTVIETIVATTVTPPPTTVVVSKTVAPPPPPPTPAADCAFWDDGFFYEFEIYNIEDWASDGGKALKKQEDGCGTITGWNWVDESSTTHTKVHFNIDVLLKAGCIERAIVSAGGPKISCKGEGVAKRSLNLEPRRAERDEPIHLAMSEKEVKAAISIYGNVTDHPAYIPMDWSGTSWFSTM